MEMSVYALPTDVESIKQNADDADRSVSEYVRSQLEECDDE